MIDTGSVYSFWFFSSPHFGSKMVKIEDKCLGNKTRIQNIQNAQAAMEEKLGMLLGSF